MEEIDLRSLFQYFKERMMWIIATLILFIVVGNVFVFVTKTPMYRASTKILVTSDTKNMMTSYSELVKSKNVLETTLENLDLDINYRNLQSNIVVSPVTDTEMMKIAVGYRDSATAAKIADEIVNVFSKEVQTVYKVKSVTVIDKAVGESKPYNINFIKYNVMFCGAALLLSCGIIFVLFYFDTTIKSSDDIEKQLGLPVVGLVPEVEGVEKYEK